MELYLQGRTQASIAAALGVTQGQISHDLSAIRRAWVKDAVRDFDELKSRELAKIDNLEVTYWQAWTDSQRDIESETEQLRGGRLVKGERGESDKIQPASIDKTKRTQEQTGDPRFLQGVQWCIEKRCKILGLDAPDKVNQSGEVKITIEYVESNTTAAPDTNAESGQG